MPTARLILELGIEHAHSLKDRRQVVRSLKDKLRRAIIGIAAISASTDYLTGQLQQVEQAATRIATGLGAEILDATIDILDE